MSLQQLRLQVHSAASARPLRPLRLSRSSRVAAKSTAYYKPDVPGLQEALTRPRATGNAVSDLLYKLQLCVKIFFPEKPKNVTPKEEVKRRLKMVLVADRCGMDPSSLGELKKTIAKALQDFVDIESEESIEVNISDDPGLGTVYCVAIPVRRVKAETRFTADGRPIPAQAGALLPDGVLLEWDPADLHSDPSSRFPMGC